MSERHYENEVIQTLFSGFVSSLSERTPEGVPFNSINLTSFDSIGIIEQSVDG